MKINPISFSGSIRIQLENKSMNPQKGDPRTPSKMSLIKCIADENRVAFFVGKDVILLSSSTKLQKQLKEAGIDYTVEIESGI